MIPGGVTEIIWHFLGYFHHIDEVAKDRFVYEDGGASARPDDYVVDLKETFLRFDLEDFDTDKIPAPRFDPSALAPAIEHPVSADRPVKPLRETDTEVDDSREPPVVRYPPVSALANGTEEMVIRLKYVSGGEQQLAELNQLNVMADDDQLLVDPDRVPGLFDIDIDAELQEAIETAEDHVPEALALPQGTAAAAEFIAAYDEKIAENGGSDGEHSVAPGRYVNGELQPEPETTEAPEAPEVPEAVEEPVTSDPAAKGQWAELGSNQATNAALIVDFKEGTNTTIVLGDFFKTNAIVQSNLFSDNDQIHAAGGDIEPGAVVSGENKTENIAEFQQNPGVFATFPAVFAGLQWNVDIVNGDFYDVNLVTQKNWLSDNDVAVQESEQTHYEAHLGENEQLNLTQIFDGEIRYDLIIVCGDFHGANWIFQYNVLLDCDILKIAAGEDAGDATSQSALSGQNALLNDASIVTYGDDVFAKPDDATIDLLDSLATYPDTLDPSWGWLLPGNGSGVLNVLYVTGDYYDINAIWQVNLIADLDTALQLLAAPPPEAIGGDGTLTQSASTGGNEATNDAVIVDVGATSSLVGGEVYQDSILIQGELVAENNDKIVFGDANALVSEVVAFTGDDTEPEGELTFVPTPIPADDVVGSIVT